MKKGILSFIIGSLLLGCVGGGEKSQQDIKNKIFFDYRKSIEKFDIGVLTDSIFQIIPLKTTDNALIAAIDKIEIRNDYIFIKDDLAKSVFMYNKDGKYLNKINAVGQGPGEYTHLSYMTVTDSTVILIDHLMRKQLTYRLPDLKFIKDERIFDKIWATEVFTLADAVCYYNGWGITGSGKYLLFSRKSNETDFEKHLPFKKEPLSLSLSGPNYAVNENEASMIFSGNDMIYRYNSQGEVYPEYEVIFNNEKVVYSSGRVENVYKENPPGRIIGIRAINESKEFLFIDISVTTDSDRPEESGNHSVYTCLFNKMNHETIIYPHRALNGKFDNERINVKRIIDNKLIDWRNANGLKLQNDYVYSKQTFNNKAFEKRLKEVLSNLKEDDNPVLFIYNLK